MSPTSIKETGGRRFPYHRCMVPWENHFTVAVLFNQNENVFSVLLNKAT